MKTTTHKGIKTNTSDKFSKIGPFAKSLTLIAILLLYLPILMLVISSFNESRYGGEWTGFSLKWYIRLFEEEQLWKALRNSVLIACTTTIASTILGTTAALALTRYSTTLQRFHWGLLYSPLIVPDLLMGVSLLVLFVLIHVKLGLFTVFIAHTTFCLSYVAMIIQGRLRLFDQSIIEAAYDLGASSWSVFWRIKIPMLLPALFGGALLAFTLSLDDFVISFFVVGPGATTLPIYVYSMIKFGSPPLVNALSTLLLIVTFSLAWVGQKFLKEV